MGYFSVRDRKVNGVNLTLFLSIFAIIYNDYTYHYDEGRRPYFHVLLLKKAVFSCFLNCKLQS